MSDAVGGKSAVGNEQPHESSPLVEGHVERRLVYDTAEHADLDVALWRAGGDPVVATSQPSGRGRMEEFC